jgi:hypothetical protein
MLKLSFSFSNEMGTWKIVAGDTLGEICDLLPCAIQKAGALYRLMKILGPEECKMTLTRKGDSKG